jgi:16S rRNA (adenine1518-N6/adenine1519-N6)-dimethyltransferase
VAATGLVVVSGVSPKKGLGQHWLNDLASLESICAAADVREGDQVLEIGPGTGSLTRVLIDRGAKIFAIEYDTEAVDFLEKDLTSYIPNQLKLEQADIRTFNLKRLEGDYKIVANIPYYLTSNLIKIISESDHPPTIAVLLVQKEVAERVCATAGEMSLLSVSAQFYWQTELGLVVPAQLFTPAPKIDSQVLILKSRQKPLFEVDSKRFFRLVKAGFAARRKTLLNSLSGGLRVDKEHIHGLLESAQIEPSKRPQDLSLDNWFALYQTACSQELI